MSRYLRRGVNLVKLVLQKKGWTQLQLAVELDVSTATISQWKRTGVISDKRKDQMICLLGCEGDDSEGKWLLLDEFTGARERSRLWCEWFHTSLFGLPKTFSFSEVRTEAEEEEDVDTVLDIDELTDPQRRLFDERCETIEFTNEQRRAFVEEREGEYLPIGFYDLFIDEHLEDSARDNCIFVLRQLFEECDAIGLLIPPPIHGGGKFEIQHIESYRVIEKALHSWAYYFVYALREISWLGGNSDELLGDDARFPMNVHYSVLSAGPLFGLRNTLIDGDFRTTNYDREILRKRVAEKTSSLRCLLIDMVEACAKAGEPVRTDVFVILEECPERFAEIEFPGQRDRQLPPMFLAEPYGVQELFLQTQRFEMYVTACLKSLVKKVDQLQKTVEKVGA